MPNNAAYFNGRLATALHVTLGASSEPWTTSEVDDIVIWAIASLYPRFSRALDPEDTTVTVVADTYYYDLPAGVMAVSRIDRFNSDGVDYGPTHGGAWEIVGDVEAGTGKLHIGGALALAGDVLHLHGYGRYDVATNLVPDYLVPLVLAKARAEAYRRVTADRELFRTWLSRNQTQNISVNEVLQMINEAQREADRLEVMTPKVWQKPVQGRVG